MKTEEKRNGLRRLTLKSSTNWEEFGELADTTAACSADGRIATATKEAAEVLTAAGLPTGPHVSLPGKRWEPLTEEQIAAGSANALMKSLPEEFRTAPKFNRSMTADPNLSDPLTVEWYAAWVLYDAWAIDLFRRAGNIEHSIEWAIKLGYDFASMQVERGGWNRAAEAGERHRQFVKAGGVAAGRAAREAADEAVAEARQIAAAIRKQHPKWSNTRIADQIVARRPDIGLSANTLRRKIAERRAK